MKDLRWSSPDWDLNEVLWQDLKCAVNAGQCDNSAKKSGTKFHHSDIKVSSQVIANV